jgi:transposase
MDRRIVRACYEFAVITKAKVGFKALAGLKTVAQLAREYAAHPTQVTQWKATIRNRLPELFEGGVAGTEDQEQLIAQLHQKIG